MTSLPQPAIFATAVPGFAEGTLILTPAGPVFVQDLRPGDLVLTLDGGPQPLRQITSMIPAQVVCIAPDSRGAATPWRHLHLTAQPAPVGLTSPNTRQTRHYHLHCDAAHTGWAEGMAVPLCAAISQPRARRMARRLVTA